MHQPQASCILHRTWTGDSFLIWYYTCFNAVQWLNRNVGGLLSLELCRLMIPWLQKRAAMLKYTYSIQCLPPDHEGPHSYSFWGSRAEDAYFSVRTSQCLWQVREKSSMWIPVAWFRMQLVYSSNYIQRWGAVSESTVHRNRYPSNHLAEIPFQGEGTAHPPPYCFQIGTYYFIISPTVCWGFPFFYILINIIIKPFWQMWDDISL